MVKTIIQVIIEEIFKMQNINGFGPNQLYFGRNPNYPSILHDKLPVFEDVTSSKVIAQILDFYAQYLKSIRF